jgi:hypothetical protein
MAAPDLNPSRLLGYMIDLIAMNDVWIEYQTVPGCRSAW